LMKTRFLALLISSSIAFSAVPLHASVYAAAAEVKQVKIVKSVNFRTVPSTSSGDRIRFLQPGELLELIGTPSANWLQVKDSNGVTGYVSSSSTYVQITSVAVPPVYNGEILSSVSFRTGPSTNDSRMRYLQKGEQVVVLEKVNSSWYKISDKNNQAGYVSTGSQYIRTSFVPAPEQPPEEAPSFKPNASIVSSVSFRTGPSTDASRIRYLKTGEEVLVVDKPNSYWYKVQDQTGVYGYVSTGSQYITTSYIPPKNEEPEKPVEEEPVKDEPLEELHPLEPNASIVSSVSFRTGPNTDASRIRYLKTGEKVLIVDKTNDYWYKVQDQDGVYGYVSTSSKYITTSYVEPYKLIPYAEAADLAIEAGMRYLGTPYEFGSDRSSTATFDCSDFVRQAYADGIRLMLPGDSRSQSAYVQAVGKTSADWKQLKRGDLLFFMSYKGSSASSYAGIDKKTETVTHVGIYLGDGKMLHTYSQESGGVRIDSIVGTAWELRFLHGGSTY
jgi:cell wall-associated NlpC family hydrolase